MNATRQQRWYCAAAAAAALVLAGGATANGQRNTPKPLPATSPAVPVERLPLFSGTGAPDRTFRTDSLKPGGMRDYLIGLNPGDRFTVSVRGDKRAGMRFSVYAPAEEKPLFEAPVEASAHTFAAIIQRGADYRVRVSRAASGGGPPSARYTLRAARRG